MADAVHDLYKEISNLNGLSEGAKALVQFALKIGGGDTEHSAARYVVRPDNFVTFQPHWKRALNLAVTLRGNPCEFELQDGLQLKRSMNGYSSFSLEKIEHLAAAFRYVRRAKEIYDRGSNRIPKTQKTIEL